MKSQPSSHRGKKEDRVQAAHERLNGLFQAFVDSALCELKNACGSGLRTDVAAQRVGKAERDDSTFVLLRISPTFESRFTPRQKQIARLVGRGLTNKEIAEQLGIHRTTVAAHLRAIYQKLRVKNRCEVARQSVIFS